MTNWTNAADLRAQVQRLWDKGRLLASMDAAETGMPKSQDGAVGSLFPLRLVLRAPTSGELAEQFEAVRAWSQALQQEAQAGYRLEMREFRHRVFGRNELPQQAWVDSLEDAVRLIGKRMQVQRFGQLLDATRERQPALLPWLHRQPLRALDLAQDWPQLLEIVAWLRAHPQPDIYLRQVDLPGIHSKFIEGRRGVLAELLDLALPPHSIETLISGSANFARRYGFRDKPIRIRLRTLDASQRLLGTATDEDIAVGHDTFASLDPAASRVFITENEVNYLAFPAAAHSLVIFGAGYGFDRLAAAPWLHRKTLHYWGDIDTHGFAILDGLRAHFPRAQSLLMDRATLLAHRPQCTDEPEPTVRDLPRLTPAERALYDDLRWKRLEPRALRLEQERIGYGHVERAITRACV